MTTNEPIIQVYRVYIEAPVQTVWEAITSPQWTERYGYGGAVDYDLSAGGKFIGYSSEGMRAFGAPEVAIDGEVLEVDAPHRLVQTWRMLMDDAMKAQGFTRLTYDLTAMSDGVTRLTLTHDLTGAPNLANLLAGGYEDQGAGGGWAWVLSGLKTLLETGTPLPVFRPGGE